MVPELAETFTKNSCIAYRFKRIFQIRRFQLFLKSDQIYPYAVEIWFMTSRANSQRFLRALPYNVPEPFLKYFKRIAVILEHMRFPY